MKKFLVVDDGIGMLKLIRIMLQDMGIEVDIARGGVQALAKLSQFKYDAILVDELMPDMRGVQFSRIVKGKEPCPYFNKSYKVDCPIYIISNWTKDEIVSRFGEGNNFNEDISGFISKYNIMEQLNGIFAQTVG